MTSKLNSYVPKFFVELNRTNDDVITVSTNYFSPQGDQYVVDRRVISPSVIQTTQSLQELQPEISTVYPYKGVTPVDFDGSTILLSPSIETVPTASQHYYAPIYFERYNPTVVRLIDNSFTELTVSSQIL